MKSPLRIGAGAAPKRQSPDRSGQLLSGKARRIASLSTAAAIVVGVGAASALFVDYLADRALAREAEAPATVVPVAARVVEASAETKVAALDAEPALQPAAAVEPVEPPKAEIEVEAPDPAAVAKVTVGPEHAIELPADDPTADPTVKLGEIAEEVPSVDASVPNEEPLSADAGEESQADETETAAIASYAAEEPANGAQPARNTEVASLPGVDVGGLAGHASGDDDAKTAAKNRGGVAAGSARVTAAVNLRTGPGQGSSVALVVPAGSAVNVISCDGWCQVVYKGTKGWVYKSFLTGSKLPGKAAASKPQKQPAAKADAKSASTDQPAAPAPREAISSRL